MKKDPRRDRDWRCVVTVAESAESNVDEQQRLSLGTAAARNLATTTKSVPQMQAISSRWLLRVLPWIETKGGVYRVNRRLSYTVGDGRVQFTSVGSGIRVVPLELCELPLFRGFEDEAVLGSLAGRFVRQDFEPGDVIVEFGHRSDQAFLVAHGKLNRVGPGRYGDETILGMLADGDHFGDEALIDPHSIWEFTVKAATSGTLLMLPQRAFDEAASQSEELRAHVEAFKAILAAPRNPHGEANIDVLSGHDGEPDVPGTFVDYELSPREYELSVAQTVLRVHTRVADLYNEPMDQVEQQLRLAIEALRERQEHELINNRDIGLLHNADLQQRVHARTGPPTPDDLDDLLALVWKEPTCFLARSQTIAAFGHECNRRGIYPTPTELNGHKVFAWRGVPILPCNKIPISETRTSTILLLRAGLANQGVIGLHQTGIPDEYQPSLSVRFMGISEKAIMSYLVSAYYSAAVLVPDALALLEDVEIGRES